VPARVSGPRTDAAGLAELEPLWAELHRHHLEVSFYRGLVEDLELSWARRREWYAHLLARGACFVTATDAESRLVGYAMVAFENGPDDTFAVCRGTVEVVTLVVSADRRSAGVGSELLRAVEAIARDRRFDAVKIAVMSGNALAQGFYEAHGYSVAEHVLYRRLDGE
jgi:ribosomal protein S18 acetylase RimI-like enzyme